MVKDDAFLGHHCHDRIIVGGGRLPSEPVRAGLAAPIDGGRVGGLR